MTETKNSCKNCKFAVYQDEGYSNYTVEGTTFYCALGSHPQGSFDRWYRENDLLNYICDAHSVGEPIEMDVDRENVSGLTPDQLRIYKLIE